MKKKINKNILVLITSLVLTLGLVFLIKYILDHNVKKGRESLVKDLGRKSSVLSNNYLNTNKPIYKNSHYKDTITCYNAPGPKIKGGIRVNYYNAGRSLLL